MANVDSPPFSVKVRTASASIPPEFELNINNGTWWPNSTRTDMTYSNAHQHTNGRCLEFAWAQHSRPPGDHTSVRWTDFTANGAPTRGYYWPENDPLIRETDNFPTIYIPWRQWVWYVGSKIIDIGKGAAIFRNLDGSGKTARDVVDTVYIGHQNPNFDSNYNPACLVNPTDDWTCYFGGGYFTNSIGSDPPHVNLIDDNPSYPANSAKPLRRRRISYSSSIPSPIYLRHAVKVGDWIYWGGARVRNDGTRFREFYRIHVPTLRDKLTVRQERVTDAPVSSNSSFPLLAADEQRRRIYLVNHEGASWYQIPPEDGPSGTWHGPYSIPNWRSVIGQEDLNQWWGVIGTHRSDLNQTFFRFNLSRRWNRIRWKN
jgi:hypothetical protein